jgi:kynureninase
MSGPQANGRSIVQLFPAFRVGQSKWRDTCGESSNVQDADWFQPQDEILKELRQLQTARADDCTPID